MIALLLALLWAGTAQATDGWRVMPGETIETIAVGLGDPDLAPELRALNGLSATDQPVAGAELRLPAPRGELTRPHVLYLSGAVLATPPGQPTAALGVGAYLAPGTTVCTGEGAFATLRLAARQYSLEHDDINLLPGTCLTLERAEIDQNVRQSRVQVSRGSVSVRAVDAGAGRVTVRTPSGVTTGDQGGFRVTVETGAARTEAVDGAVAVLGGGRSVRVGVGEGTRVRPGQVPDAPVPLLRPGPLATPKDGDLLLAPDFRWVAVDRALAYRVELSASEDFSEILMMEEVGEELWEPDRLFLPYRVPGLWWRVSPVDRAGYVGLPSRARSLAFPYGLGP